jgi:MoaA/NifB/PqqE/SkfB family radical SAM enzyme
MKINASDIKRYLRLYCRPQNQIEYLTFFITTACNLRCRHCFYWKELGKKQDRLTLDEIAQIAQNIGQFNKLSITGGEAFLDPDLVQTAKIFYQVNKIKHLTIPTNGFSSHRVLSFTEQILEACADLNLYLAVSFDGLKETHNEIRGAEESFDNALSTMEQLKELRRRYPQLILGITMTLFSMNQGEMVEAYRFLKRVGANSITVNVIRGDVEDDEHKKIDLEAYKKVTALIKKDLFEGSLSLSAIFNLLAAIDIMKYDYIARFLQERKMIVPCTAGKFNAVLYRNGDAFPCELLNRKIGNVRDFDYDVKKLLNSAEAERIRQYIKASMCACTHECFVNQNILLHPRFLPKIAFNMMKLALSPGRRKVSV